jgi:sugar transferase (PEP-CTERM/EpsH1 system associated)
VVALRVLIIAPVVPYPPITGARVRQYNLIKQLSRRHKVTLVCFDELQSGHGHAPELTRYCESVHVFPINHPSLTSVCDYVSSGRPAAVVACTSGEAKETVTRLIIERPFDVVNVHTYYTAENLGSSNGLPTVIVEHALQFVASQRFARVAGLIKGKVIEMDALRQRLWQLRVWNRFDVCAVCSEADSQLMQPLFRDKSIRIVPNGVDCDYFDYYSVSERARNTLVFVGNLRYVANRDAMQYFCLRILPRIRERLGNVKLWIVGNEPPRSIRRLGNMKGVFVTGTVSDVRPYLRTASVFVSPLRVGSGTRLKVLEAMAVGAPVVSTSIGCEGLEAQHGEHVLLADDEVSFADSVVSVLSEPRLGEGLARRARMLVEHTCRWQDAAAALERCYEAACLARHEPRSEALPPEVEQAHAGKESDSKGEG